MNYPKKSSWGFSTHYTVSNGKDTFTLSAKFHPTDKYWFYISENGEFDVILEGDCFFDKTYTILNQWYDADHWYNEIVYKEPKEPTEYNEIAE